MSVARWYVVHTYSGFEKKVAESLKEQATKFGLSEMIEEISVPTQEVLEVKRGTRVNTEKKFFPGYILIKMIMNDDTWHLVKNNPKVSNFLGSKGKPIPISNSEASKISEQVLQGLEKPTPTIVYEIGEQIKVIDGPFASCDGMIEQIDEEKSKIKVALSIFGRSTPVELEYTQIEKV